MRLLKISELAKAADTTVHTVRNYMSCRLLQCADHTAGGFGLFDEAALKRLRFIRCARQAGLLIEDIKPLLQALDSGDNKAANNARRTIKIKITEKQQALDKTEHALQYGHATL